MKQVLEFSEFELDREGVLRRKIEREAREFDFYGTKDTNREIEQSAEAMMDQIDSSKKPSKHQD